MSTRSATNKRTQSHEVTGVARKSAASAKPARQAASSVRVVPASSKARRKELEKGENLEGLSKEEKRARKAKQRAKEDRIYTVSNILLKQDEDYTKRRRIWWAVLTIGMVLVGKNEVERRNAVGGDHQQVFTGIVDITNLATGIRTTLHRCHVSHSLPKYDSNAGSFPHVFANSERQGRNPSFTE